MTASFSGLRLSVACSVGIPGASSTALLDGLPAIFWPSTMKPVTETVIFAGWSEVSAAHVSPHQPQATTQGQQELGYSRLTRCWAPRKCAPSDLQRHALPTLALAPSDMVPH